MKSNDSVGKFSDEINGEFEPGIWETDAPGWPVEIVRKMVLEWFGRGFSRGFLCEFPGVSLRSGT
jgi:hypothetical protein